RDRNVTGVQTCALPISTLVILATSDGGLAKIWERQLAPGRIALRLDASGLPCGSYAGLAAVIVLDATSERLLPPALVRAPTIYEIGRASCRERAEVTVR